MFRCVNKFCVWICSACELKGLFVTAVNELVWISIVGIRRQTSVENYSTQKYLEKKLRDKLWHFWDTQVDNSSTGVEIKRKANVHPRTGHEDPGVE